MDSPVPDFPTRSRLWRGVVRSTIAHALWEAGKGFWPDHQWPDPHNYVMNNEQGNYGVITFRPDLLAAVFFDRDSPRSPFRRGADPYDIERCLIGMPAHLRAVADAETLQYRLEDLNGAVQPVITAAFWGEGERLTAAEPWADVWANGANLLWEQLLGQEQAFAEIQAGSEFTPAETALVRSLFERRMAQQGGQMALTEAEREAFLAKGGAGIEESRQLLAAIGIVLP